MPHAVIVGAGIGGLAAALALRRAGWDVTVLERAGAIGEVGAGLQISPNGHRALASLGLAGAVEAKAFEPGAIRMVHGRDGAPIVAIPMGAAARKRWAAPYLQVHRADLIGALRDGLDAAAPGSVRTGAAVETVMPGAAGRPAAILATGERVSADLVVGADGVRSVARKAILEADAPRFTGNVAWRATVPASALGDAAPPGDAVIWAGSGRHAVTYPLRGGALINFVAIVEEDAWAAEGWAEAGDPAALASLFSDWAPPVARIVAHARPFRWGLFDRPSPPRWSDGRVVLIGDAAHPMLPSLAQGACQALEDAVALAAALPVAATDDVEAALGAFFTRRIARVTRIQREARRNLRVFHKSNPRAYLPIRAVARAAPWFFHRRLDWLYRG